MNSWIISGGYGGGLVIEPYNMSWDPRVRMHILDSHHHTSTSLDINDVIAVRDALQAFIVQTSKPKETA